jgi:MFS transporter, FHS family, L-fucose permease
MKNPVIPPAASAGGRAGAAYLPILIIGSLFFIFGFVTWLNGTLIPFLKLACDLKTDAQALLVTFAFYIAYFCLALPSSVILGKTGFKGGIVLGLVVMAAGCLLFIPAANLRSFGLFLTGLFVQGMGLALMQTATNPYIAIIGPHESAASRMGIMGICNKVAGALSPLILSAIVLKGAGRVETQLQGASGSDRLRLLADLSHRIVVPYAVMAAVLFLLAGLIRISPLPEIEPEGVAPSAARRGEKNNIFEFPHLLLGVACLFLYVGVEVMAGDVIVPYARKLGLDIDRAKSLTSETMWWMVAGYLIGSLLVPRVLRQEVVFRVCAVFGMILSCAIFLAGGMTSISLIALLGLANSMMWPVFFPLAVAGLGKFTKTGSALLIMGIAGGAVIPQVYAHLAHVIGIRASFLACTLPSYAYIFYYAWRGHRVGREKALEPLVQPTITA